ncbi:MgtC/SapB family protein [Paludibacterium paludis]|uniref:MgtC/SapB transporter n=1 Tax=Paludibacterium paludis TaxID=1225769 RepID=A0A918P575_9NEIS|nr:MgtC/SapB family protein [Paludibacterium paludis]GGY20942.1 MgtC/SapB transporter [Paludibacterium paludis]
MAGLDPSDWLLVSGTPYQALPSVVTSLAIGLLIGVERERKPRPIAGIRTFSLVCLLGTLTALAGAALSSALLPAAGFLCVAAFGFLPMPAGNPPRESSATTIAALLATFCLGCLVAVGYAALAVAGAILVTGLLYLKPELSGLSHRLERRDLHALLRFAALSFIVLPLLPNRNFGPYDAFNPHHAWLVVVLVVGVSLAGYLAVKFLGDKANGPLLGVLGGLVSSTATSLVYAREARANPASRGFAVSVILMANLVLFARLTLLTALLFPSALPAVALALMPALGAGIFAALVTAARHRAASERAALTLSNPTELKLALEFGALFAFVTFVAAWLNSEFGSRGVYLVAVISGMNDVDAISLSVLNLFGEARLSIGQTVSAMALAIGANTLFKFGLIASAGGTPLARLCLPTLLSSLAGLAAGVFVSVAG